MVTLRPFDLAARQIDLDVEATKRYPSLHARKRARMSLSPHVLMRGSAPLFYQILASCPDLATGPEGEGWIVGDMHLENIGAYRDDDGRIVFDLNDFDDATIGPWRFDVLRLSTSLVLAARASNVAGPETVSLVERLTGGYVDAVFYARNHEPPPMPEPMTAIVNAASERGKKDLLDARAPFDHGKRRLIRGERYFDLEPKVAEMVPALLKKYVEVLGVRAPQRAKGWVIEDVAFRVAGTGSLGRMRFAVLVKDDAGEERILDFKEAAPPSYQPPGSAPEDPKDAAARVVTAARKLVAQVPRLLAAVPLDDAGISFVARQLTPQEDKLDLSTLKQGRGLREIGARVGYVVGAAHTRSAKAPEHPWSAAECGRIVDHALELAGLFEAIYLAYVRIAPLAQG